MGYSPWDDLGDRPHICVDTHTLELSQGQGWWLPDVLGIVLDRRLTRVERRCALAHELRHVDHHDVQVAGIGPDGPRIARRQETRADREAARRLIDVHRLAAAVAAHPDDAQTVADELDVTTDVLHCRLAHLLVAERELVRSALDRAEHAA